MSFYFDASFFLALFIEPALVYLAGVVVVAVVREIGFET